ASIFHVEGKHFVGNGKAQLTQLKLYPEQKHEEFDAVHSPLPWIPIVPTDKLKFKVSDHQQDVGAILTSQPYVYRRKLKWYTSIARTTPLIVEANSPSHQRSGLRGRNGVLGSLSS